MAGVNLPPNFIYMPTVLLDIKLNKADIFNKLQAGKYMVICEATKKLFSIIVTDINTEDPQETKIVFTSPEGYRDCPVKNLHFTKNHRGDLCVAGMTSLNGWGAYNSPFSGCIYKPIKDSSEII
jgi:hypothetical protein